MEIRVEDAQATRQLGGELAQILEAGDLIILVGDLGAGKTTFVQGLGASLGVRGRVTSPTYIVARTHRAGEGSLPLVHVDAYRLVDALDLESVDLEAGLEESVTVVEWGRGKVEELSEARLEVELEFGAGADERVIRFLPVGPSWQKRMEQFWLGRESS